jgi:drug/metabolite transporter (DMT)-like permease
MLLAILLLGERTGGWRWLGAGIGLVGVFLIVAPAQVAFNTGIIAAFGAVIFGSLAVVQTRALAGENTTVLMVFYTVGLTVFTAAPATLFWQPVAPGDWPLLITIGVLAQLGQYCFLRAYQTTPANILAPWGYLSLVLATIAGFVAFGEVPGPTVVAGAAVIVAALTITARLDRRHRLSGR